MSIRLQIFDKGAILIILAMMATVILSSDSYANEPGSGSEVPDNIHIVIADNMMAVTVDRAPLYHVLARLSELVDLRVFSDTPLTHSVSLSVSGVTVPQGMHRILSGLNFAVEYGEPGIGQLPHENQPGVLTVYIVSDNASAIGNTRPSNLSETGNSSTQPTPPEDQQAELKLDSLEALNHIDPDIRLTAIETISENASYDDIGVIYPFLNDQSARVREAAITVISQRAGNDSIHFLEQLTSDESARVRETTYELAEDLGSTEAVGVLITGLHDVDHFIQQQTIEAIAEIGGQDAVSALRDAWFRGGYQVRKSILLALPELSGADSLELLSIALNDSENEIRRRAIHAAAELDSSAVAQLIHKALEDKDVAVRKAARELITEYSQ